MEYPELKPYYIKHANPKGSLLMVGCGNSSNHITRNKPTDVRRRVKAYYRITSQANIDISETVIAKMHSMHPHLKYMVMDATHMKFNNSEFDYVIDKGTLDALACATLPDDAILLCKEMYRVAKDKVFIISHSPNRDKILKDIVGTSKITIEEVELSSLSLFTNILRSKLQGNTIKSAMENPKILADAMNQCMRNCR